jgi:hypothetical protein
MASPAPEAPAGLGGPMRSEPDSGGGEGASGPPWRAAVGFGLVAGLLVGFALVGLIAAPLFLWAAATEPGTGLQRPFVRHGLRSAPFVGLVGFAVTAVGAAAWRRRNSRPAGRATMTSDG